MEDIEASYDDSKLEERVRASVGRLFPVADAVHADDAIDRQRR